MAVLWADGGSGVTETTMSSGDHSNNNSTTVKPYVPFDRVFLIGFAGEQSMVLITSSYEFYNVSIGNFHGGNLALFNASVTPLSEKFAHNEAFADVDNDTELHHGISLQHANQSYLYFALDDSIRQVNSSGGRIVNLNSSSGEKLQAIGSLEDHWLSVKDNDSEVYLVRSEPHSMAVSIAKGLFTWKNSSISTDKNASQSLADMSNTTAFFTICLVEPGAHNQTITLTMKPCEYPVTWKGPFSGFVTQSYIFIFSIDRVYIFTLSLFKAAVAAAAGKDDDKDSKKLFVDQFYQSTFNQFFWSEEGSADEPLDLAFLFLLILFVMVVLFLLFLIGMLLWRRDRDEKTPITWTLRQETRLKEFYNLQNKGAVKGKELRFTSKFLPSAAESQKGSLRTNWFDDPPSAPPATPAVVKSAAPKVVPPLWPPPKSASRNKQSKSTPKAGKGKMASSSKSGVAKSAMAKSALAKSAVAKSALAKSAVVKSKALTKVVKSLKSKGKLKKVLLGKESSSSASANQIKSALKQKQSAKVGGKQMKSKRKSTIKKIKGDKSRGSSSRK